MFRPNPNKWNFFHSNIVISNQLMKHLEKEITNIRIFYIISKSVPKSIFLVGRRSGFYISVYISKYSGRFYPVGSGEKFQYCFNSLLMVVQNCMVQWRQPHDV